MATASIGVVRLTGLFILRFDKLEFEGAPQRKKPAPQRTSAKKDEHHWLRLADYNRRCGAHENALRFYSRALEQNKSLVSAWVGQMQMLVYLEEYPQADLWGRKALEVFPANSELMTARAQARCRMGDLKQALALSDGALKQPGETAFRWLVRGEIMVATKQSTDEHCFDRAQQTDSDWFVPLEAALIYLFYHVPSKAQRRALLAAQSAADAYYAWYVLGVCQSELGFDAQARTSFERCLELCPKHDGAQRRLTDLQRTSRTLSSAFRRMIGWT